jgi:hypothetical protein
MAKMREHSVHADSVEDFLNRYTLPHRKRAMEEDGRAEARVQSAYEDIKKLGYTLMSKHESITGEMVTYSPAWCLAPEVKRPRAGMKPEIRWRQDERSGLHGFDVRRSG